MRRQFFVGNSAAGDFAPGKRPRYYLSQHLNGWEKIAGVNAATLHHPQRRFLLRHLLISSCCGGAHAAPPAAWRLRAVRVALGWWISRKWRKQCPPARSWVSSVVRHTAQRLGAF